MTWRAVWKHQLRWARTIRVCQPVPYFFSILSNAGFWAMLWFACGIWNAWSIRAHVRLVDPVSVSESRLPCGLFIARFRFGHRILIACHLQSRLTRSSKRDLYFWLVPIKDLLQAAIWLCAFAGKQHRMARTGLPIASRWNAGKSPAKRTDSCVRGRWSSVLENRLPMACGLTYFQASCASSSIG